MSKRCLALVIDERDISLTNVTHLTSLNKPGPNTIVPPSISGTYSAVIIPRKPPELRLVLDDMEPSNDHQSSEFDVFCDQLHLEVALDAVADPFPDVLVSEGTPIIPNLYHFLSAAIPRSNPVLTPVESIQNNEEPFEDVPIEIWHSVWENHHELY